MCTRMDGVNIFHVQIILVISLKMPQSDWLMKCKDTVIMTLRYAKTIFLDA